MACGIMINGKFYWNIDAHVGPGRANRTDDVQLVQLGYFCMAQGLKAPLAPEEREAYGAVVPGAPYTGSPSDPLSNAIRVHEKFRGGTQDGVVSPIQNSTGRYSSKAWIMIPLDNNVADSLGDDWPHLNRHPQCPNALAETVVRVLTPFG